MVRPAAVLVAAGVLILLVAGCSSSAEGGDATPATPSSGASPSSASAAGEGVVTDGPVRLELGSADYTEAEPQVREKARLRTFELGEAGDPLRCIVQVNVQADYSGDFPQAQILFLKTLTEGKGGTVLLNEAEPGPQGVRAARVAHTTYPGQKYPELTDWVRSFVTPGGSMVEVVATAPTAVVDQCGSEQIVRSVTWTGEEAGTSGAA